MSDILLKILEMSIMGSVVILVTILMRFLFRKSSKKYVMLLWIIVALRLLVPVSFESAVSVFNIIPHKLTHISAVADEPMVDASSTTKVVPNAKKVENATTALDAKVSPSKETSDVTTKAANAETETSKNVQVAKVVDSDKKVDSAASKTNVVKNPVSKTKVSAVETNKSISLGTVLGIVYGAGVVVIAGYCVVNYVLLKRRLKDAKEIEKNVFESEKVVSPFVFGFISPKIYLPDVLDENEREFILIHERTHIKHGDWISKFIGIVVVAVHWFNPLVWIGYSLFEQDVEMLCDEDTVSTMDRDVKKAYMMSIVSYAKKSRGKVYLVVPLSFSKPNFGKKEVTNRVKNMINYRKGTKLTAILTTIVVFGVSTACAFNSTTETKDDTQTKATTVKETVAESVEETEVNEETESVFDEAVETQSLNFDDLTDDDIDYLAQRYDYVATTYFYNLLMDKADELHSEDDDNSLIYGFVDVNSFQVAEYRMFVYDTATGEYTTYCFDMETRSVEKSDYEPFENYEDMNNTEPEKWLMPYEDFVAFPGATTFNLFRLNSDGYDKNTYHSVMEDGRYKGNLYALSEDFSYATVEIALLPDCDYVVDNLEDLNIGDAVEFNGQNMKIRDYSKDDKTGFIYAGLDDEDYSTVYRETFADGDAVLVEVYTYGEIIKNTLVQLPIADDAVINIYNETADEFVTLNKDTFMDYFVSVEVDNWHTGYGIFEGSGIAFENAATIQYYNKPLVIKDGEIVEMTIHMRPLA